MTMPLNSRITPMPACEPAGSTPAAATSVPDDLFAALMGKTRNEKPRDAATPSQDGMVEASGADDDDVRLMWPLLAVAMVTPHATAPQPDMNAAAPSTGDSRGVTIDAALSKAAKPDAASASNMDVKPCGAGPPVSPAGSVVVGSATHRPPSSLGAQMAGASPTVCDEAENTLKFTMPDEDNGAPGDKITLPSARSEIEEGKTDLTGPIIERDSASGIAPGSVAAQVASCLREALAPSDNGQPPAMPGPDAEPAWYKAQLRILDIVLKPEHLGRIGIKMKLAGDGLSVLLTPQTEKARHLLEGQLDSLRDSLTTAGYDLTAIGIKQGPDLRPFEDWRRDSATPGAPRDSAGAETTQGNGRHEGRDAGQGRQDQSAARRGHEPEKKSIATRTGVYV